MKVDQNQIAAVILDLDGTLLDSVTAAKNILNEFLGKYGKSADPEKEKKRLGKTQKESAASIVVDYELHMTPHEFSRKIMPTYQERWNQAKPLPGVNRLIRHLHNHGVPLALASNSIKKHIEIKISHQLGWKEMFAVILGGDEVANGKPSPDIFLEAAKRLGVDTSNCLVIEDSLVGVTAAKDSGAHVVAVPSLQNQDNHYSIAHCVLHSLLEFQPDLWGLPAFEDCLHIPTHPRYVKYQGGAKLRKEKELRGIEGRIWGRTARGLERIGRFHSLIKKRISLIHGFQYQLQHHQQKEEGTASLYTNAQMTVP